MKNKDNISASSAPVPIMLRPHHGMCLAYFAGYGYSGDFTAHMRRMQETLKKGAVVRLVVKTDAICQACPNNIDGLCEKPDLVSRYDREVLSCCGLNEETELMFADFEKLVHEKVLKPGLRQKICGNCQWNELCGKDANI